MLPNNLLHFTGAIHHYHNIHRGYTSRIEQAEDLLRALSLLLPGRVSEGDLCSQTILTTLNLVSLYNTHYLMRTANKNSKDDIPPEESFAFNRHIQFHFRRSKAYRATSLILSLVSYSEILWEMLVARKENGSRLRWRHITVIEAIKMCMRLILYYTSQKKMVLHPTHFIRNIDPTTLEYDTTGEDKIELGHLDTRIGMPSSSNRSLYYNPQIVTKNSSQTSKLGHLSELLWISRPLIYVLLLNKEHYQHPKAQISDNNSSIVTDGKESFGEETLTEEEWTEKDDENYWQPWIISFSMDILAMILRYTQNMSPLEKEESKRRNYLLFFYLLRGPLYSKFTRHILDTLCNATEHKPLVSIITTAINDYRPFWEQCYFYTSGS
ncbi:peroxisome membrane protein [Halteromyces radiatus]|uniref:peroxisome membrane protein n=1 Tax=Halteromyces radiatus TaxID=101107 RepID=UPI0022207F9E|nr:peroxisome membrane protein [Halteromyces radiatus]KAI8084450.1 peroxisome membrane protein [Halteromyces radiatus]